jgi:hypothetical protein
MITHTLFDHTVPTLFRRSDLALRPDWPWGDHLSGDPLLRADDKAIGEYCGQRHGLASLVLSLRDARARAEIRARAERKARALEQQLTDIRRRGLGALEQEAAQELADQRTLLALIAEDE